MNRRFIIAAAILIVAIIAIALAFSGVNRGGPDQRVKVAASFYTFAEFARQLPG